MITWPAVSGQCFVVWPWLFDQHNGGGWLPNGTADEWLWVLGWLAVFNGLLFGLYWNYYLACATDPGTVPLDWVRILVNYCVLLYI